MRKYIKLIWILISIIAFVVIYTKLKPKTPTEVFEDCQSVYSQEIKDKICNAYYGGRIPVIIKLCSGKEIIWYCNYSKFREYRDNLKNYPGKTLFRHSPNFNRIDSIYKPQNSYDLYIYIDSNPDSLVYLKCDYSCKQIEP